MTLRLTKLAARDVEAILNDTAIAFGRRHVEAYSALIDKALSMVEQNPYRPGSRDCPLMDNGIRQMHLDLAAERSGAAAHRLYYLPESDGVVSGLRVLHQRMEPAPHLAKALQQG